jgi:hypothetical protein
MLQQELAVLHKGTVHRHIPCRAAEAAVISLLGENH